MTDAADPQTLLAWMQKRTGIITGRDISDSGPRPFRRRAAANVALAALIKAGDLVEASARPRSFRVSGQNGPKSGRASEAERQRPINSEKQKKLGVVDLRHLLDVAVSQHRHAGRSKAAALILGAADVRNAMRGDPRHGPEPTTYAMCQHCGGDIEGQYAELSNGIRTHVGCVLRYRNAIDRRLDMLIADALDGGLFTACSTRYEAAVERT